MVFSGKMLQTIFAVLFMYSVLLDTISAQTVADGSEIGVDNYVLANRRQYANVIANLDRTMDTFRANYDNQIATINTQSDLLAKRLDDAYAALNPLDVLNPISRTCVQKYRSNIASVATVKATIAACSAAATSAYPTFIQAAQTTRANLNNYYLTNFETLLANCNKTFPSNRALANYTDCVETTINTVNVVTTTNQKTFDTQMEAAECSAKARIKLSIDCSYTTQFNTISAIGEYTRLINNCIAGLDTCPPCPAPAPTAPVCSSTVRITAADAAKTVEKINNPFRDLDAAASCVIVSKSA